MSPLATRGVPGDASRAVVLPYSSRVDGQGGEIAMRLSILAPAVPPGLSPGRISRRTFILKDRHMYPSCALGRMLQATFALALPPHGRINYRCYPVWNEGRSNLDVMWNGERYSQPWAFHAEVDSFVTTCLAHACVERLWCTGSGAVGRYVRDAAQSDHGRNVRLEYAWLLNTSANGSRALAVTDG